MGTGGYQFLFDIEDAGETRVFHDPTKRRGGRLRRLSLALSLMLLTWMILFMGNTVSLSGLVGELRLWWDIKHVQKIEQVPADHLHEHDTPEGVFVASARANESVAQTCPEPSDAGQGARPGAGGMRFFGHIPTEQEAAPLSLNESCGALDVLLPDWFTIKATPDALRVEVADVSVREAVTHFRKTALDAPALMPTVILDTGYDVESFLTRFLTPVNHAAIARDLVSAAQSLDAAGLCLDFKQLDAAQLSQLAPAFEGITGQLHSAGLQSCIVVSERQEIWQDRTLMQPFDSVILKAFQEPWVGSPPGPLAAETWFEDLAKRALAAVGPEKLTLALGNFATDWTTGVPLPTQLPFAEAIARIADADAEPRFSPEIGNSFATYRDPSRGSHKLWMLDAASATNQMLTLRALGVRNVGIWSLGREDPGIWRVLAGPIDTPNAIASHLSRLTLRNHVAYVGEGAFLRVAGRPRPGLRAVDVDPASGRIRAVTYLQMPKPYKLERYGQPAANKLVLTFDDGPDPVYTAAILDSLKESGTPAAFFVVGTRVMQEPELVSRMIDEGHEIGSHTFSHPRMDQVSHSRIELEHGMMSKLIAGYTGHGTRLYREPFQRSGGPIEESRVRSLEEVQNRGGIIAGMDIVPKDWTGMTTEAIVDHVVAEVNKGAGNVILLHDGGKDRTASVNAVPLIIDRLGAQGYEFTTLADLLGMTRAELMPQVNGRWQVFDRLSFEFLSATWLSIETIFWAVLIIGIGRTLIILLLAMIRGRARPIDAGHDPKVTVVIPAYNEEKVIANCIKSVLASDYDNFDIMVVDDGSQDETFNEMLRFRSHPKVSLLAKLNQGKWSALNAAVARTTSEVIICIDADTEIDPGAIRHLARHFSNPRIGAVAGKITVGNRSSILTRLQALEYVTAQNFDRRAYDLVNGIMVVPGAIGAWRVAAVRAAGRYCSDTMTEDADLTIAVNRAGYRVSYEERAIAYTEAPETVGQLLGQRLRWTLGMFQCAWKHKGAFVERRMVGLLSIPDMLIFGYLFPLLAPIADLFVLLLVYRWFSGDWSGEVGPGTGDTPYYMIGAYLVLPLFDLLVAAFAVKSDDRESLHLLWLFPFQRFFYRQLLYFSVYRSVLRAITGSLAGWGKKQRGGELVLQRRPT